MTEILFFSAEAPATGAIAAAIAREAAPHDVNISCMCTNGCNLAPHALTVFSEHVPPLNPPAVISLEEAAARRFDLVVTLGERARAECPPLPGNPGIVAWNAIPAPADSASGREVLEHLRLTRDVVKKLVADFFSLGYYKSVLSVRKNLLTVLDNLSDGVITHDNKRLITHFNKAAEQITGFGAADVIGRDCHVVFPNGFCGGKCSFGDCTAVPLFDRMSYSLDFTTPAGETKRLEMLVSPMVDENGARTGVIASFKDMTRLLELETRLGETSGFAGIIGRDHKMQALYKLIRDIAGTDAPVLIEGETGTGKELVAAAVHAESRRAGKHFVPVNCGALPEGIIESELFGHVKGAFTGAIRDKKGRFELADGGTIFLDEVGDLPPSIQVKLLRVLQQGTFERVGGEQTIKVDVRVVSATNRDLKTLMSRGEFREDLYYRLAVVPLLLPPLRERRNDILLLAEHFLQTFSEEYGRAPVSLSPECIRMLLDFDWPGNIRQLQNAMQFCLMKCKDNVIRAEHLPPEIIASFAGAPRSSQPGRKHKLDRDAVESAIRQAGGNKLKAAKILGVGRATLYRYLDSNE